MLLPDIRRVSGNLYTFRQDSVPAHRARATVEMLKTGKSRLHSTRPLVTKFAGFNPTDHSVWSILPEKVYQHRINDLDELTHRLRAEWSNLDHAVHGRSSHSSVASLFVSLSESWRWTFRTSFLSQSLTLHTCSLVLTLRMCKLTLQKCAVLSSNVCNTM